MREQLERLVAQAEQHGNDPYWLGKKYAWQTALVLLDEQEA